MRKNEAEKLFKQEYPNYKEMSRTDKGVTWNAFTEHLYQTELITEKQLYNWGHPVFIKK